MLRAFSAYQMHEMQTAATDVLVVWRVCQFVMCLCPAKPDLCPVWCGDFRVPRNTEEDVHLYEGSGEMFSVVPHVNTRAAVRLKFLIAINRAIKKIIAINLIINRKVKNRQYVSVIIQSTVHFTQKSCNLILECNLMLALRLLSLQAQSVI